MSVKRKNVLISTRIWNSFDEFFHLFAKLKSNLHWQASEFGPFGPFLQVAVFDHKFPEIGDSLLDQFRPIWFDECVCTKRI